MANTDKASTGTKTDVNPPNQAVTEPTQKPKQHHVGKSKRELSDRAKIIIQGLLEDKTTDQALKDTGLSDSYIKGHRKEILSHPVMQQTFTKVLESAGVTDDFLAGKIRHLIDAKETKFFSHKGEVTAREEVEALDIQANMVQFAAKLKGHVVDRSASLNVNVDCSPVDMSKYLNSVDKPVDNTGMLIDVIPDSQCDPCKVSK